MTSPISIVISPLTVNIIHTFQVLWDYCYIHSARNRPLLACTKPEKMGSYSQTMTSPGTSTLQVRIQVLASQDRGHSLVNAAGHLSGDFHSRGSLLDVTFQVAYH